MGLARLATLQFRIHFTSRVKQAKRFRSLDYLDRSVDAASEEL